MFTGIFICCCIARSKGLNTLSSLEFRCTILNFQGTALALCLVDLLSWSTSATLAVISWWLWFHCLLVFDALTPSLTRKLKHFGLPVIIVILSVAAGCALELIKENDNGFFSSCVSI